MEGLVEIKAQVETLQKTNYDLIKTLDDVKKVREDVKSIESANCLVKEKTEKMSADILDIGTKVSAMIAERSRPPVDIGGETKAKDWPAREALIKVMGQKNLNDEDRLELKTLSENNLAGGGFLVPTDWTNEIIRIVRLVSPIRSIARVTTTIRGDYEIPKITTAIQGGWTAETGTRSASATLPYGKEKIPVHEMYARIAVSNTLFDDAIVNIEAELKTDMSDALAQLEGTAFVNGNGVNRPEGILTNAALIASRVSTGDANLLTYQGLVNIWSALATPYAIRASWILSRSALGSLLSLTDGHGRPLINFNGLAEGMKPLLLGNPTVECPDLAAVAASAYPIAFGDWQKAYRIVDRLGITIKRVEDSTTLETGTFQIFVHRRLGGQIVLAEAARLQFVAA